MHIRQYLNKTFYLLLLQFSHQKVARLQLELSNKDILLLTSRTVYLKDRNQTVLKSIPWNLTIIFLKGTQQQPLKQEKD